MATQKNFAQQIVDLRNVLKGMGQTDDQIEAQVKIAVANMIEPVRKEVTDALLKAATKVTEQKSFKDNLELLKGSVLAVYIEVDRKGSITVRERTVTKRKRSATATANGKRPILVRNGKEFDSWANLCRADGLEIGGDSARRVYERAHQENAEKFPMPDEIEKSDETSDQK